MLHLADLQIVVTPGGETPTPGNSVPIGCERDTDRGARCSMIWFTQGSVFRSAELAFTTVKATEAKEKEAQRRNPRAEPYYPTTFDSKSAILNDFFPPADPAIH